jgi:hypothetical protein
MRTLVCAFGVLRGHRARVRRDSLPFVHFVCFATVRLTLRVEINGYLPAHFS